MSIILGELHHILKDISASVNLYIAHWLEIVTIQL